MPDAGLVQPIVALLVLVSIGLLCRVLGIINEAGQQQLTRLVINLFVPVMLFMAGLKSDPAGLARESGLVFAGGLVLPLLGYGLGALVARAVQLSSAQASVVRISASLCNTAFVGIPVCTALWGVEGALLAAVYDQALSFPLLTLPPMEYGQGQGRPPWRSLFLSPILWGLALGVACKLAGLTLPGWAANPLDMIGGATLPLSLVLVGSLALPGQIGRAMARPLAAFVGSRLIVAPLATLAVVWLLGLHGVAAGVLVLQTAMPASVLATVMAKEYKADADLAAAGALLTVLLSAVTLPLMVTLLFLRGV